MDKLFVCKCFFTRNYFLSKYGFHVVYEGKERFLEQYTKALQEKCCSTSEQVDEVLSELEKEKSRRMEIGQQSLDRRHAIKEKYQPLHQHVYHLQDWMLAPEFLDLVCYCQSEGACEDELTERMTSHAAELVYSFPVFSEDFCKQFLEEIEHFEASDAPKGRPNTMNNYGVLLNELGFDDHFISPLRRDYLSHVTKILYPEWGGGCLDSHKAFTVKYKIEEDTSLSYHYDNAEVTINICLGKSFTGGDLYFGGMRKSDMLESNFRQSQHRITHGILHRGQHKHGASGISSGERYNLIIWLRSSAVRNELCPMCDQKPQLVQTVGVGDGFTLPNHKVVDVCSVT